MGSIQNYAEVQKALRGVTAHGRRAEKRLAREAGREVQWWARSLVNARSHPPNTPTPSSPGEPPARITGELSKQIRVGKMTVDRSRGTSVTVSSGVVYAAIQERGGFAGRNRQTRIPARPYMRPARLLAKRKMRQIARQAWEQT